MLLDLYVTLEHRLRNEIVSVRPWIEEEEHRRQALQRGIPAARIDRLNVMHDWPEHRRARFDTIFKRGEGEDPEGRSRSMYTPVSDDELIEVEALDLIAHMRVFKQVRRIQVIVDSRLAQDATSVYGRELKRRLPSDKTKLMYRHPGLGRLLGVESEDAVDDVMGKILLPGRDAESEFTSYRLRFCSSDEVEEVMKSGDVNIVLSSSGMCDVGPIVPHLVRELPQQKATVVLTGYADPASLGGKLKAISRSQELRHTTQLQIGEVSMPARNVRARIEDLSGFYSGHADRGGLLDFIFRRSGARFERDACTVFINHGDDRKRNALAEAIRVVLPPHHRTGSIRNVARDHGLEPRAVDVA